MITFGNIYFRLSNRWVFFSNLSSFFLSNDSDIKKKPYIFRTGLIVNEKFAPFTIPHTTGFFTFFFVVVVFFVFFK